jgi:hypothetical protein
MTTSRIVQVVIATAALAAHGGQGAREHRVEGGSDPPAFMDSFRWQEEGPIAFLETLRRTQTVYTVDGVHVGWVKAQDAQRLVDLLDSSEPCAFVVSPYSSYIPPGRSFVGQEAVFLLEGYRAGRYPPGLHSGNAYKRKSEILVWWKARMRG